MGQVFKPVENIEQESSLDSLRKQFDNKNEKDKQFKVVTLKYKSCCGCGCSYKDIQRTVPFDSDLEDEDIISEMLEDDIYV